MLHLNLLVGMNNPRKSCREVQRINIQEGSQLFSIFLSWKFFEQNCAWFVNKMDITCFHKRKMKKSWLPSSILIPYAFQHDFLVLFIPMNNMRCSILSHVEKNQFESRNKRKKMATMHNSFTFHQEPLSALLNVEYWILKNFSWNFLYCGGGGSYRRMCWWKRVIQCSKWIWSSFRISSHTFKCKNSMINFCCK